MIDDKKANEAIGRIKGKLADLDKKTEGTGRSFGSVFGSGLLRQAAGAVTAFASVGTAISLVTAEVRGSSADRQGERHPADRGRESECCGAQHSGLSSAARAAILKQNEKLAAQTQVSEVYINQARAEALSASSGNVAASLEATRISALYNRGGNESAIGEYAGSLLDVGPPPAPTDALTNLGLLSKIGGLSRVVDPRAQAQTIPAPSSTRGRLGLARRMGRPCLPR